MNMFIRTEEEPVKLAGKNRVKSILKKYEGTLFRGRQLHPPNNLEKNYYIAPPSPSKNVGATPN
jgi:hypothetical protein